MGRYLAIDYGTKRTGLAVTDPLNMIATPLNTIASHELMHFISGYIHEVDVERLIVGRPVKLDNTPSETQKHVNRFVQAFKKRFPGITVEWMDERFTSSIAVQTMIAGGMKKKDRESRAHVDRISAVIILQSYLELQNNLK